MRSDVKIVTHRPAVTSYPPGATTGPRSHSSFQLLWVISGSVEWTWFTPQGEEKVRIGRGDVLIKRPDMREFFEWDRSVPTVHGWVDFELEPSSNTYSEWPLRRSTTFPHPAGPLFEYLVWLGGEPVSDWQARTATCVEALLQFLLEPEIRLQKADEPAPLGRALDVVSQSWTREIRPVSVSALTRIASVSREHLSRLCREHYGIGLRSGLEGVRLYLAVRLLMDTNMSVKEVALSCGYDDALYFSRRFRQSFEYSPREFRFRSSLHPPAFPPEIQRLSQRTLTQSRLYGVSTGGLDDVISPPLRPTTPPLT